MITGTVTMGIGGFYYVATEGGIAQCRAMGRLRKENIKPLAGDRVKIRITSENPYEGAIEEIEDRKNHLIRPPVANVDQIVIVISTTNPNPDYLMVDKLIVTAEKAGIDVIIAANKIDLAPSDEIMKIYKNAGFKSVETCAAQNEGAEPLRLAITGKIVALAGNSGVGKSSVLNRFGFSLETGGISKIKRGRHTTRHTELLPFGKDKFIIDTPGFSLLEVKGIKADGLQGYFREFKCFSPCRFPDCAHINVSADDCAVYTAVQNGEISKSRYESYTHIYDVLKDEKDWEA